MFKKVSVYLAIIGMVAAVLLVKKLRHVDPPPPPLAEPAHAPFPESIGARGIVESVDENVHIAPSSPGLVTKVFVKVGDEVKIGDPLIEQDSRDARAQVLMQEAQVAALRAQIKEAEVALADRKDQLDRIEKLIVTKVSSVDERQRAYFNEQGADARLATSRAQLAAAEAQLNRSRVLVDLLTTLAPRSGRILQVNVRAGEYATFEFAAVSTPDPAILLGDVTQLQLRADVDEDNASRVRASCKALAYIKGRRETAIPLHFVRIEPYIVPKKSLTGESSERVDTRVLQIIFRFDQNPSQSIYVGQQMDVFLDAGSATK
jgi:HlyD family secretion protein